MVRRHYAVLAQISLSYSAPEGRYPRVTHPCATRRSPEGEVSFDLHVLGMPPAFVLSQDQTLKLMTDQQRRKLKACEHRGPSLGAVPAQIILLRNGYVIGHVRNDLIVPISGALRSPEPGPPPTCPFILIDNVKEPTFPHPCHQELSGYRSKKRPERGHKRMPVAASGSSDICGPSDSVNSLRQFYFKKNRAARESAGLQLLHHDRLNPAKGLTIKAGRI